MNLNTALGILSAIAFFLPVAVIFYYKLFENFCLLALVIYFLLTTTYTLMIEGILPVTESFRKNWGVITNYLDVPLMLTSMLLFCVNKWKQKLVTGIVITFAVYELYLLFLYQLQPVGVTYLMGPGILVVAAFGLHFFIIGIKATIGHGKGLGKTLMAASITFAYGCYFLLYVFAYIQKTPNKADVFTIYYIASIIFSVTMALGLLWLNKRLRQIQEVQNTRKELNLFFNN